MFKDLNNFYCELLFIIIFFIIIIITLHVGQLGKEKKKQTPNTQKFNRGYPKTSFQLVDFYLSGCL